VSYLVLENTTAQLINEEENPTEVDSLDDTIANDSVDEEQRMISETTLAMNVAPATNKSTLTREIALYTKIPILPMNMDILVFGGIIMSLCQCWQK
jgi:hypothetical protein